jgi:hypothetical protein
MKKFFLGSAVLTCLLWFSGSTAQAQVPQINVYTGGIPPWYTWYGYPGNMSFYYGPSAATAREVVEVRAPARVSREVVYVLPRARKTREVVYVERPEAKRPIRVAANRAVIRVVVPPGPPCGSKTG